MPVPHLSHSRNQSLKLLASLVLFSLLLLDSPGIPFSPAIEVSASSESHGPSSIFNGPVRVEDTPANDTMQTMPDVAIAPGGIIYVVWTDFRSGVGSIFFARSLDGGLSFRDHRLVSSGAAMPAEYPAIQVSGDGTIHVVWIESVSGPDVVLLYAKSVDGGLSFTTPKRLDTLVPWGTGKHYRDPLAVFGTNVYVAWMDDPALGPSDCRVYIVRSTDNGDAFSPETRVDDSGGFGVYCGGPDASISVDETGALYVLWGAQWPSGGFQCLRLSASFTGGATWQTSTRVDDPSLGLVGFGSPAFDAVGNGIVYVALDAQQADLNYSLVLVVSIDSGTSFLPGVQVNNPAIEESSQLRPAIVGNSLGTVWVIWNSRRGVPENSDIYFARSGDEGLSFFPEISAVAWPEDQITPRIAAGGNGNITIVWEHRHVPIVGPATGDIYAQTYRGDMPDFVVSRTEIVIEPTPPVLPGTLLAVNATLRNLGWANATDTIVRLSLDNPAGPSLENTTVSIISGRGGRVDVSFAWTPQVPGTHTLCVVADPDDLIAEEDESNNAGCVAVKVLTPPDLTISDRDLATNSSDIRLDDDVLINATVWNLGEAPAVNVSVIFFRDTNGNRLPETGEPFDFQNVSSIPELANASSVARWTAGPLGTQTVCAYADPQGDIPEGNETNNGGCIDLVVLALPDYVPINPRPSASFKVGLGVTISLSTDVRNAGGPTNVTATLTFYNESTPSSPFSFAIVQPVSPGGNSGPFEANYTSPTTPGLYLVVADVDYWNNMRESNESNDIQVWEIEVVRGPVTSLAIGYPNYTSTATYLTSSTPLDFSITDQSGLGIRNTTYRIDGGDWINYTATGTLFLTGEGGHVVEWRSFDWAGNLEAVNSMTLRVDDTPPATSLSIGDPKHLVGGNFVTSSTPLALQSSDGGTTPVGIEATRYRIDGGSWDNYSSPFTLIGDGTHLIEYNSSDLLGNDETTSSVLIIVDDAPPATTILVSTPKHQAAELYVASSTPINLTSTDGGAVPVGLARTEYQTDGGGWLPYSSNITLAGADGPRTIEYRSVDLLGNVEETRNITVILDNTPPATTIFPATDKVDAGTLFTLDATDSGSGVSFTEYMVDGGGWITYSDAFALSEGRHNITYRSVDNLGNVEDEKYLEVTVSSPYVPPAIEANYKPIVAVIFAIILAVAGLWSSKKRPWKGGKDRMAVMKAFIAIPMPLVLAEAGTGIVSFATGKLRVPPFVGLGTVIDLTILLTGLAATVLRATKTKPSRAEVPEDPESG